MEDAVPSVSNTYLGCNQKNITIDEAIVNEKNEMFARLTAPVHGTTLEEDKKDAQNSFVDSKILQDAASSPSNQGVFSPRNQPSKASVNSS